MRSCRSLAVDTASAGLVPALLVTCVLALASGLAACGGSADSETPPAATDPAPPAGPGKSPGPEPPRPASPSPAAETPQPPITPPDPPFPELPAEPVAPDPTTAVTPTDEPASPATRASEPTAAPMDPAMRDPADPEVAPTATAAETRILRYDIFDPSGSVAEPGHYAFLADPHDPSSVVTTYEGLRAGLRNGATIGLLIHKADADGASQAALYDAVEAGDLVEWREASDCWMRYVVTEVHPDPTGAPPRKLLTIQVYSYPYPDTGCSGALRTTGSRTFTWTPELMRTGNFTVPFHHGPFLIAPRTWSEDLPETASITPPVITWPPDSIPNPNLGNGWSGGTFFGYGGRLEGFYRHEDGGTFIISIFQMYRWPDEVQRIGGVGADLSREFANEYRVIDGLPAWVSYEYTLDDMSRAVVVIYDPANGVMYSASGGTVAQRNDPEATIALLRKFLLDTP